MSNITLVNSGYALGEIDTAQVLVNNVSPRAAEHVNGATSAIIQMQQVLGVGPSLRGTHSDLVARLAIALGSDGRVGLAPANVNGTLTVPNGGTGITQLPSNRVVMGNGVSPFIGGTGLIFQGPTSTVSGSSLAHEGTVVISGNQALSGLHFYNSFTLNAGVTVTAATGSGQTVIVASDSITINGTISTVGGGQAGGAGGTGASNGTAGTNSSDQPGGNGGTSDGGGGTGGDAVDPYGLVLGSTTQVTSAILGGAILHPFLFRGGAGGGGGGGQVPANTGGAGGRGGGTVVLIAPLIILGSTATITTAGSNGSGGVGNSGRGGGGAAGNIFIITQQFTNNGVTYVQTGGTSAGGGVAGTAGKDGIRQIMIYGS